LRALLDEYEQDCRSAERFPALARKYPDFDELTPQMLHEAEKIDGERRQQIDIHLNFIGQFIAPSEPVPEPTPEEIAATP
jgi:hypothetical protein